MPILVVIIALLALDGCTQVLGIPEAHRGSCDPDAAFAHMAPVGGLESDLGEQSAQLSRDELSILFSRPTLGGSRDAPAPRYGDLYMAHRDHMDDDFRDAVALDELNTSLDELGASLSEGSHALYFAQGGPSLRYRIFAASWSSTGGPLGDRTPLALGDASESQLEPYVTSSAIFFTSQRADGASHLFTAAGRGTAFGATQLLASLEMQMATASYGSPVVSSDELTIYFSAPPDNASQPDIWTASRSAVDRPFAEPHAIAELNTVSSERPAWISPDSCRLYFVTNRSGRGERVWMASRVSP